MKPAPICLMVLFAFALSPSVSAQDSYTAEHLALANKLHQEHLVLDTHSDVTPKFENAEYDFSARSERGHMDIPRMREGGLDAEFMSIYMGNVTGEGRAIRRALVRIDSVHETVRKHPDKLALASTAADVRRIKKAGKIACLMGIEGGHIIEDSLSALRMFHRLGCRYMTLTHSFNTNWADSSGTMSDVKGEHGGLNEMGRGIVREMNRLGMMVDISHVADSTFWAAMEVSTAPLIASHSSVRGVYEHRRNLSDKMLTALAEKDGVVMVNFFSGYIDPEHDQRRKNWEKEHAAALAEMATKFKANRRAYRRARSDFTKKNPLPQTKLTVLARHVEHIAKTVGWDHVGIGADWDGVSALPEGIRHCGDLPKLTALLIARGARPEQLVGFLGENLLRVLHACEVEAERLKSSR